MKTILEISREIATEAHSGQFIEKTPAIEYSQSIAQKIKAWTLAYFEEYTTGDFLIDNIIAGSIGEFQCPIEDWKTYYLQIIEGLGVMSNVMANPKYTPAFIGALFRKNNIPKYIFSPLVCALEIITRRAGESYTNYIIRIKNSELVKLVKLAEIKQSTVSDTNELAQYILLN